MPATRLTMRKIREVLRLTFDCHLTKRQIAKSCLIARSTVAEYLRRFFASGLSWPLSPATDDEKLEQLLFPPAPVVVDKSREPLDFVTIHRELRRKAVTLMLLWQEYKATDPGGYQYSQFCHLYHQWKGQIDPVMRMEHPAGETLFVDWAGMTADIFDPLSGEVQQAQIFVAVLAASGYTYAEATATQQLPDWIGAHCRAFAFFNGVSQLLVPDNTRTGITKACFYEPDINPTYLNLADRIGVSTAAISQWSKGMIDKGVLAWCDENGFRIEDVNELEKAKRTGKAHLCVERAASLPSPFELTGDPRWDKGGELYEAYDLKLEDGGDDSGQAAAATQNIISGTAGKGLSGNIRDSLEVGVKALSEKSHIEELKIADELEQDLTGSELDPFMGQDPAEMFRKIL